MLLTLIPPTSYPIPKELSTHSFPPPSKTKTKFHCKVLAFSRANKALESLGIKLPCFLAAERTNWLSLAVKEVTWNLDSEQIEVYFIDGTIEKWEFEEPIRDPGIGKSNYPSEESVVESPSEENISWEKSKVHQLEDEREKVIKELKGKGKIKESILDQLISFSIELRSAFEDLGVTHPSTFESEDYSKILQLSAKPNLPIPKEWNLDLDEADRHFITSEGDTKVQLASPPASPPSAVSSEDEDPTIPSRGQFVNKRRPTLLPSTASTTDTNKSHDILSFIHLLSTTRTHLINLFSSSIIPILKKRLPPTYSLWIASNGVKALRTKALIRGAKVAKLVLDLLDDDGETYDVSEVEEEEEEHENEEGSDAEFEKEEILESTRSWWDFGTKNRKETVEEKRERRLQKNFLFEVFDDLSLRIWCEKALNKGNELVRLKKEGGSQPIWMGVVQSWDMARTLPSTSIKHKSTKSKSKAEKSASDRLLETRIFNSSNSKKNLNQFSLLSDEDTDTEEVNHLQYDCVYFYPQNTMQEEILPPRLPKTLLGQSDLSPGKELATMRKNIKTEFDAIAGLQKKMVELENFIELGYLEWDEILHENDIEKKLTNGNRITGRPVKTLDKDGTVIASAQPLRYYTADVNLASSLKNTKRKGTPLISTPPRSPKKPSTSSNKLNLTTIIPRKRQRANLASLEMLSAEPSKKEKREAIETFVLIKKRKVSKEEKEGSGKRKKKEVKWSDQDQTATTELATSAPVQLPSIFDFSVDNFKPHLGNLGLGFTRILHSTSPGTTSNYTPTQFLPSYSTLPLQFPSTNSNLLSSSGARSLSTGVLRLSPQALSNQRKGFSNEDLTGNSTTTGWKSFDQKELDAESGDLLVEPLEAHEDDLDSIMSFEDRSSLWQDTDSEWEEGDEERDGLFGLTRKFSSSSHETIRIDDELMKDEEETEEIHLDLLEDDDIHVGEDEDKIELAESIIRPSLSFPKSFSSTPPIVDQSSSSLPTSSVIDNISNSTPLDSQPQLIHPSIIISPTPIRPVSAPRLEVFETSTTELNLEKDSPTKQKKSV